MWSSAWRVWRACLQQCSIHQRGEAGSVRKHAHKQGASVFLEKRASEASRNAPKLTWRLLQVSVKSVARRRTGVRRVRKLLGESKVPPSLVNSCKVLWNMPVLLDLCFARMYARWRFVLAIVPPHWPIVWKYFFQHFYLLRVNGRDSLLITC